MQDIKLGVVEARFADIIWSNAPLTTKELVALCEKELNWKRTTTYTVLKKLCDRGIFAVDASIITVKLSKEEFSARQCEKFVAEHYNGSLPAFIAAFTANKAPSAKELAQIKALLNTFDEVAE